MKYSLIILFLISIKLHADEPRYSNIFFSANNKFAFISSEAKTEKWKIINFKTNEKLYEIEISAGEKTASISNDGQYVVVINDWPSEPPNNNLEMINIYYKGQLVKKFVLKELLDFTANISSSVSHFTWSFGTPRVNFNSDKIEFSTYDLNDITIKISTGEISKTKKVPNTALLIYGEITNKYSEVYEMKVCHKAFGHLTDEVIKFKSKKIFYAKQYYTILIDNGSEINSRYKDYNLDRLLLNSCELKLDK
jgi:hypothetical protein